MSSFVLGAGDVADTRFALSPLSETVLSLRVLRDPGLSALHLPWRRAVVGQLAALDVELLLSLVARQRTLPDFLTPRPVTHFASFPEELAAVRDTPPDAVRRGLRDAHAPQPLPEPLRAASAEAAGGGDDAAVRALTDAVCRALEGYWEVAIAPWWPQIRLVLEADMTYRARQLATGGMRLMFADMHPDLRWRDGVLEIHQLVGDGFRTRGAGRGLLLVPSVFAHKPAPPVTSEVAPVLAYPSRGVGTLWADAPPGPPPGALTDLLGATRARLLVLLEEPLATVEVARRFRVTPSAVSQHLRVLFATGLVTRARHGRQVLYRRTALGDQLVGDQLIADPLVGGDRLSRSASPAAACRPRRP
ncbi:ArsR/SmtB family transcription factor [Streptomyces cavernicola]|uniref:Helix-turn-helix domain-containing protein n=1 Tax=Streptomyces cavernicola TaxID=3043613 RepID=A0ABT6SBM2_9ACTN|nr:helix-turn-helix domain-containing protein [Streptomyces sp. B-S-A6]MDI3404696.1 helix-turn-helix domain-containing protein [Streptomyces sp. B-S-A6]